MLKLLLTVLSLSFVPLMVHMFDFLPVSYAHIIDVVLPIIISSAFLILYILFIVSRCLKNKGKDCFNYPQK